MNTKLIGKILINAQVTCKTGLHVGGSTTSLEIGGVDNPVIKDPLTDEPYIPGSSLKGKLRSLSEWSYGLIKLHPKHKSYQAYECEELKTPIDKTDNPERWKLVYILARLYGPASDDAQVRRTAGPTRLTVRDCYLTENSKKELQLNLGSGTFTEVKTENSLDRVTAEANPRPIERVPAGAKFDLNLILDIYDGEDRELLKSLFMALSLVEHSSLGGGGSRGSGQVSFDQFKIIWRSVQDYKEGNEGNPISLVENSLSYLVQHFEEIAWPI